jgi:hypothetical protein
MKKNKVDKTKPVSNGEDELEKMLKKFDWKCYLENNPSLIGLITTKEMALRHFKYYGYKEGRKCTPQPIVKTNIIESIKKEQSNKILIVLDRYLKGGLEKHTELLVKFLKCDVVVFDKSLFCHKYLKDINYTDYDIIIWQNTFNKLPEKNVSQRYIYIVHSQCSWWSDKNKDTVKLNNRLIDEYIYVSDSVKTTFETNVLVPINSNVIENQVEEIINDKKEIEGLFISCGSFNNFKGHYELIQEFSKLDNRLYKLEIYGDIHDLNYFNKLKTYIDINNINNIKLFEYTENYIERLKEAEYFCLFSKTEGCSYAILEAISLNKKIICSKESITFEQIYYYPYKKINFNDSINVNNFYTIPSYTIFIEKYYKICLNIENNKLHIGYKNINLNISDKLLELDIQYGFNIKLKNGLSFLLRIKNEEKYILNNIYSILPFADEIIICNNGSTDNTTSILNYFNNFYPTIFIYEYNIEINNVTKNNSSIYKTKIGTFYNWCLSKVTRNNVIKWDGDFEAIANNLSKMINRYNLKNRCDKFAIWFSGLTKFYFKFINISSYYDEYRCFSKLNGFKWVDTNQCETSEEYVRNCDIRYINGYDFSVNDIWLCNKAKEIDINRMPIFIENKNNDDYKEYTLDIRCLNDNNILTKYKNVIFNISNIYKNIVFIILIKSNNVGGVYTVDNIMVKSLEYTGYDVKFIFLNESEKVDNINYFSINTFDKYLLLFNKYIINIITSYHDYRLIELKNKNKNIKLFGISHSDISYYNKLFIENNIYYNNILVVNNKTYDKYTNSNINNVILLKNNISLLPINNSKHNFNKNKIKCLFFSRTSYDKNLIMLIQSIDILSKKYDIQLDIYGEFNYTLYYYYDALANKSAINIYQPQLNSDINVIYNLYDIVILPSVSEGCSLNVLESINNEVPILCTKNVGNFEIINNKLPMFDFDCMHLHDNDISVNDYNKLLEYIGYSFDLNNFNLDILTPNILNNSNKNNIIYNKNVNEIINKIEYTINNYEIIKLNTINLKKELINDYFNMASYIMKINNLLTFTVNIINEPIK